MARAALRRRCIGCGRVAPKAQLLRTALQAPSGQRHPRVVIDRDGRMPGRGAYLCRAGGGGPAPACLEQAIRKGGFARALRCGAKADIADLVESVR